MPRIWELPDYNAAVYVQGRFEVAAKQLNRTCQHAAETEELYKDLANNAANVIFTSVKGHVRTTQAKDLLLANSDWAMALLDKIGMNRSAQPLNEQLATLKTMTQFFTEVSEFYRQSQEHIKSVMAIFQQAQQYGQDRIDAILYHYQYNNAGPGLADINQSQDFLEQVVLMAEEMSRSIKRVQGIDREYRAEKERYWKWATGRS